jgi:hypothetical protein
MLDAMPAPTIIRVAPVSSERREKASEGTGEEECIVDISMAAEFDRFVFVMVRTCDMTSPLRMICPNQVANNVLAQAIPCDFSSVVGYADLRIE